MASSMSPGVKASDSSLPASPCASRRMALTAASASLLATASAGPTAAARSRTFSATASSVASSPSGSPVSGCRRASARGSRGRKTRLKKASPSAADDAAAVR
eukprot:9068219-Pyramimonas_sp.AAC.1